MNLRKLFISISNKHDLYYRIVLITISILVITAFLPQQMRFKYDYDQGSVWNYDNLKAPFDFPLYKSRAVIEEEKNVILNQYPLFFTEDTLTVNRALLEFRSLYQHGKEAGKNAGETIIISFYSQGVIELPRNYSLNQEQPVMLIRGNKSIPSDLSAYYQTNQIAAEIERNLIAKNLQSDGLLLASLVQAIKPNINYDALLTEHNRQQYLESISPTRGMVKDGTLIIEKGRIIGEKEFEQLNSLKEALSGTELISTERRNSLYAGYLLLVCTAIGVLLIFIWLLRKDILLDSRKISLLFLLIVATCIIYTLLLSSNRLNMLLVPLCILPLVTRAFFDTRTALFTHVLTILMLGTIAPDGVDFVYMQVVSGMVAIFSIVNMRKRSQLFMAAGIIFIAYLVSYVGLSLLSEGSFSKVNYMNSVWLLGNCLLILLSYPLIFFIEKTFGVTSDFTLMELTDFNSELLRELATKTPGTFQHSLQVANLAESAIYKIGGNSLLVRVGALYHDVGKTDMPMYFIENQSTQINPHDELSFDESASIIISHVIHGIEKARKHKLPDVVIDFIRTHHGTMVVQYFYQSFLKNFPGEIADEEDFSYPGPKPFSKETAVLMMADSVEAAARSMPSHDAETIDKLVEKIINHQISTGQFENCDITYRDITSIKRIFKKMLASIYHIRIAYPAS
jgi:cyclic-di-AMP phosphodiesterase PgpH